MRTAILSLAMLPVLASCGASSPPPATSSATAATSNASGVRKAYALVGESDVVVELVDFADGSSLMHVKGLDSTLQDKVYRVQLVKQDGDLIYTLPWRGRDWSVVVRSGDSGWLGSYWVLRPPSSDVSVQLGYSESHSGQVNAAALQDAYEKQRRSGELDQLQRYDRRAESTREEAALASTTKRVEAECGSKLKTIIVWDTVADQALQERSISSYCSSALNALSAVCSTAEGKQFIQQNVRELACRFDGNGEMSLNTGKLSWAINFDLADLDTLASRAFSALPTTGAEAAN